jgi:hypothetical protein
MNSARPYPWFRPPHAKAGRLETELPRPVRGLVLDLVDADGILEDHAIGSGEVKEARARGRMPARAEHDRDATLAQEI